MSHFTISNLSSNVAIGVGYTYDSDEVRGQLINISGSCIDLIACRLIVNSQELMRSQVIIAKTVSTVVAVVVHTTLPALMKALYSIFKYYNII